MRACDNGCIEVLITLSSLISASEVSQPNINKNHNNLLSKRESNDFNESRKDEMYIMSLPLSVVCYFRVAQLIALHKISAHGPSTLYYKYLGPIPQSRF